MPLDDADATVHRLYAPGPWSSDGMRLELQSFPNEDLDLRFEHFKSV